MASNISLVCCLCCAKLHNDCSFHCLLQSRRFYPDVHISTYSHVACWHRLMYSYEDHAWKLRTTATTFGFCLAGLFFWRSLQIVSSERSAKTNLRGLLMRDFLPAGWPSGHPTVSQQWRDNMAAHCENGTFFRGRTASAAYRCAGPPPRCRAPARC